jgi:hypothetical protein
LAAARDCLVPTHGTLADKPDLRWARDRDFGERFCAEILRLSDKPVTVWQNRRPHPTDKPHYFYCGFERITGPNFNLHGEVELNSVNQKFLKMFFSALLLHMDRLL